MEVLVLNNSFEPLHVVSSRKAFKLVLKGKAEVLKIIENQYFSSVSQDIPMPSVVRLYQYINIKHKPLIYSRKNVLIRDKFTCQYCGIKNVKMSIDHIIPLSRKGTDTWTNVVSCCLKCNVIKSDKYLHNTEFSLLSTPKEPSYFHYLRNRHIAREEWLEFMYV